MDSRASTPAKQPSPRHSGAVSGPRWTVSCVPSGAAAPGPWPLPLTPVSPGCCPLAGSLGAFCDGAETEVSILCLHARFAGNCILDSEEFAPQIVRLFSCCLPDSRVAVESSHAILTLSALCVTCFYLLSLERLVRFSLQPWHSDVSGFSGPLWVLPGPRSLSPPWPPHRGLVLPAPGTLLRGLSAFFCALSCLSSLCLLFYSLGCLLNFIS